MLPIEYQSNSHAERTENGNMMKTSEASSGRQPIRVNLASLPSATLGRANTQRELVVHDVHARAINRYAHMSKAISQLDIVVPLSGGVRMTCCTWSLPRILRACAGFILEQNMEQG